MRARNVGDLRVDAGQHPRQRLDERDLAADVGEHRRELAPDRAAADDRDARAGPLELRARGPTTEHAHAVELEARQAAGYEPVARMSALPVELGAVVDDDAVAGGSRRPSPCP